MDIIFFGGRCNSYKIKGRKKGEKSLFFYFKQVNSKGENNRREHQIKSNKKINQYTYTINKPIIYRMGIQKVFGFRFWGVLCVPGCRQTHTFHQKTQHFPTFFTFLFFLYCLCVEVLWVFRIGYFMVGFEISQQVFDQF